MLAEQVLVLLHHPGTGRRLIWSDKVDLAVGGALLVELAGRRRIELTEPSRLTRNRTPSRCSRYPRSMSSPPQLRICSSNPPTERSRSVGADTLQVQ